MNKEAQRVMVTDDYSIFKRLEGNRTVLEPRVNKILNSIKRVGYIVNPLIVNEKYEVIDGQGRLEALKKLGYPVYYIVNDGIGLDECISMNINQANWSLLDYIACYADVGNESYKYLLDLMNEFGSTFRSVVIFYAATTKIYKEQNKVKSGEFTCSKEDYEQAKEVLTWLAQFTPIFRKMGGHTEYYYMSLMFCYSDDEVDNARLIKKLFDLQAGLMPVVTIHQALEQIECAYNDRSRNKVYIKTNYQKKLDEKMKWYHSRYGYKYKNN